MKLSTKGRYAVRAMLDIAMQGNENPVMLRDISERQEISQRYLEQVMIALRTSGLVKSVRGSGGGYELSRQPADIKLADILQVSIGELCLVDCVKNPANCSQSLTCAARDVWAEVGQSINGVLESVSLQDLADRQREKLSDSPDTYSI